jgi:hypothetical protein
MKDDFGNTAGWMALVIFISLGMGCGKHDNPITPPIPPGPVTVNATFYNHTQGPITSKAYSGISGQPLVIKISDIYASNVDSQRIAVRNAGSGSSLGALVGFSRNGEVNTAYPNNNADYDVFLMNTTAGASYQLIDEWVDKGAGTLQCSPDVKWRREDSDGYTGPEAPIDDAMSQLNNALNYSWKKYGSFTQVSSAFHIGVGYGYCDGAVGLHSATWAGVNPNFCKDYPFKLRVFLEEIFELQTNTADLGGGDTNFTICDQSTGNLNLVGRDFLAYVYVKDSKTPSGSSSKFSFSFH